MPMRNVRSNQFAEIYNGGLILDELCCTCK
jgi:hypothetical protein